MAPAVFQRSIPLILRVLAVHCADSAVFYSRHLDVRYYGYSPVLAVLWGSVLGILPVCTGNTSALSAGFTGSMLSVFDTTR